MSRSKYGIMACVPYDPYDPQHAERSSKAYYMADGVKRLPGAFSTILNEVGSTDTHSDLILTVFQGVRVSETQEFRKPFFRFSKSPQSLGRINDTIKAYKGDSRDPRWTDSEPGDSSNRWLRSDYLMLVLRRVILQSLYGVCRHFQGPQTKNQEPSRQPSCSQLRGSSLVRSYRIESTACMEGEWC